MRLEKKDIVDAPSEVVYPLVRDQLADLVPYLPNVNRIEVKERRQAGTGRTEITNHWYAKAEIPTLVKKFVSPDLLSWKDIAVWFDETASVEYRLESFIASQLFKVKGTNSFKPLPDGKTELKVVCDVEIYPEKLPGVPRLLAGTVKPVAEELIRKMLEPNLTSLAKGLNRYFAEKK